MPLVHDAVADGSFEFRAQRQHGAENFTNGSEIVVGNPLAQADQLLIEHRRGIKHADDLLGFNFRLVIMQRGDDPRHALLPEGHEHASADDRLHPLGNSVREDDVKRNGQSDVTEFGHGQCRRERPRSCCSEESLAVYSGFVVSELLGGATSPRSFITICKSFQASFFCRGSRSRNAGW